MIEVSELARKRAAVPLNLTLVAPVNPLPLIVTLDPTKPLEGAKLVIAGKGVTATPEASGGVTPIAICAGSTGGQASRVLLPSKL